MFGRGWVVVPVAKLDSPSAFPASLDSGAEGNDA